MTRGQADLDELEEFARRVEAYLALP